MKHLIILLFITLLQIQLFSQETPKKLKSNKIYEINNQVFKKDSIPLNGYYKIKYVDFLNDWKTEITHFKNGLRFGNSKILRLNKLEEEGTYINGVKHGTWKNYFYWNGTLRLTTEYKNDVKNGNEFGKRISAGYFICNYLDGVIDGTILKYDYRGYLESKEYYKKGERIYKHRYDDFLNIIEETNFSKKGNILVSEKKRNNIYIDSIYYKDTKLVNNPSDTQKIPFKIKKYKNNELFLQKEIIIQRDTTRVGNENHVLTFNYTTNKHTSIISIYYSDYFFSDTTILYIQKLLLMSSNNQTDFEFCNTKTFFFTFAFVFNELNLYLNDKKNGIIYEISYTQEENNKSYKCNKTTSNYRDYFKQTY